MTVNGMVWLDGGLFNPKTVALGLADALTTAPVDALDHATIELVGLAMDHWRDRKRIADAARLAEVEEFREPLP
jgi:hypothetical protein